MSMARGSWSWAEGEESFKKVEGKGKDAGAGAGEEGPRWWGSLVISLVFYRFFCWCLLWVGWLAWERDREREREKERFCRSCFLEVRGEGINERGGGGV